MNVIDDRRQLSRGNERHVAHCDGAIVNAATKIDRVTFLYAVHVDDVIEPRTDHLDPADRDYRQCDERDENHAEPYDQPRPNAECLLVRFHEVPWVLT